MSYTDTLRGRRPKWQRKKLTFKFSCLALRYEFFFISMNLYLIPNKIKWKIGIQNSIRVETSICIQIWLNSSDLLTTPDALLKIKFCINLRWCYVINNEVLVRNLVSIFNLWKMTSCNSGPLYAWHIGAWNCSYFVY